MSDTAGTLDDVEDVLSSIRRLVSETAEATKPPQTTSADHAMPAAQPALVLTSEQRIDQQVDTSSEQAHTEPVEAAVQQAMHADVDEPPLFETQRSDAVTGNDIRPVMLDSLRKAVSGGFEEEQRAFLSEPNATSTNEDATVTSQGNDRPDTLAAAWPVRPPEDYYEDEADKEPEQVEAWLSDGEAAPEAAVGASDEETASEDEAEADAWFDPELDPSAKPQAEAAQSTAQIHHFDPHMTVVETGWTEDGEIIDASDIVPVDAASEGEMEIDDDDSQGTDDDDADADNPPGIAAFLEGDPTESVVEDGIPDAELAEDPDGAQNDEQSDDGENSMFAAGYDAFEEEADVDETNVLADLEDPTLIDEEALRDMVTEIVRQELTGEMGERITRNVRKLVRREIHRALMTREFD